MMPQAQERGLTGSYRTGALPAQRRRHGLRQFAVLVVQVLLTKLVSQPNDLIVPRLHVLRD